MSKPKIPARVHARSCSENTGDTLNPPAGSFRHRLLNAFDRFASHVTRWAGSPLAFTLALATVLVWAVSGPIFAYSENWQLVINTGTTIVTFLMVFLIQQSQNKDCQAVHLKLDELLSALKNARNDMIDIENLSEEELQRLAERFKQPLPRS